MPLQNILSDSVINTCENNEKYLDEEKIKEDLYVAVRIRHMWMLRLHEWFVNDNITQLILWQAWFKSVKTFTTSMLTRMHILKVIYRITLSASILTIWRL